MSACLLALCLLLPAAAGAAGKNPAMPDRPGKKSNPSHSRKSPSAPHDLLDDLDRPSMIKAVENQLAAMAEAEDARQFKLGALTVTQKQLKETLAAFLRLLRDDRLAPAEFSRKVRKEFVFRRADDPKTRRTLFTGYYTPVLKASAWQTGEYTYPLYQMPDNIFKVSLTEQRPAPTAGTNFYQSFYAAKYFTREEIDGGDALANRNLEIAWLQDDIERYFLHIQGSAVLQFPDGAVKNVQYVGSNGYPYKGIGRLMIDDGALAVRDGSMQGIKNYLRHHQDDIPKYFYQNPRYIFFQLSGDMPRGSGGGELVAGRSIATDKSLYPAGGLVFLQTKKPVLNHKREITGWKNISRFAVDQDTGSTIRGPGRADLYFGIGEDAGAAAGHYMVRGKMFYLLKK